MAKSTDMRDGKPIKILTRPVGFSFWPTYRRKHRPGLQSNVFVTNPWTFIKTIIADENKCRQSVRPEASACVDQAQYFFEAAASARIVAAKPLLTYYCFMNLAKAYALVVGRHPTFDQAHHGLSPKILSPQHGEMRGAQLKAYPSPASNGKLNVFDEFYQALSNKGLTKQMSFDLVKLLPQVVTGHRLWVQASDKKERFVAIEEIESVEDQGKKEIWLRLYLFSDDLRRLHLKHKELLTNSMLNKNFRQAVTERQIDNRKLLLFEQKKSLAYRHRAADKLKELCSDVRFRNVLWTVVRSVPPYRKYYLYLAPPSEHDQILPQLMSIYATMFYLGMITRYRPHQFENILNGKYGAHVQELINSQPNQFIYLIASEFAQREVTLPAIV